jgi:hypothetical protein
VKNKLRTLTLGKKTDDVISKMASTFVALCALADWSAQPLVDEPTPRIVTPPEPLTPPEIGSTKQTELPKPRVLSIPAGLHYNIQIHLPESRDPAVYDAVFRALKEHLF